MSCRDNFNDNEVIFRGMLMKACLKTYIPTTAHFGTVLYPYWPYFSKQKCDQQIFRAVLVILLTCKNEQEYYYVKVSYFFQKNSYHGYEKVVLAL